MDATLKIRLAFKWGDLVGVIFTRRVGDFYVKTFFGEETSFYFQQDTQARTKLIKRRVCLLAIFNKNAIKDIIFKMLMIMQNLLLNLQNLESFGKKIGIVEVRRLE